MSKEQEKLLEALRASAIEVQRLRERNVALTNASREPIAIVSMGCRLPGGVQTPEDLWTLLHDEREAISFFPDNRGWDVDGLYDPDPDAFGKTYAREGGFLHDADRFDPAFFGISPREALAVDPQQRLLLETSWESFERAGIDPASLVGSQTGVFVGVIYSDYASRIRTPPPDLEGYLGIGSSPSIAAGRIAYTFGLHGPTVTLDTACSSSLVAIHLACHALRNGECALALAGGVTVMATPAAFVAMSRQRAMSPDGRCRAFSAEANGTGWSEGAGMLVLERLSDAKRHGHPVLAVLRGSAVNQDGRSQGLTAPNGPAQERVIREALQAARLEPRQVDAVEAHGTGTALGDPIEAHALLATYGRAHEGDQPLWIGSLKSNLGHTQAAAGVAGIIKMVLSMQHGLLPKTLHADHASPHIDWSTGNVRLLDRAVSWNVGDRPRRAAVSSFGISGTNAHVILEEAPADPSPTVERRRSTEQPLPLLLSAKSELALRSQAQRLGAYLEAHPELELVDVAGSLATTRPHFEHRAALATADRSTLLGTLRALAHGEIAPDTVVGQGSTHGKMAFLFTGQGSQRAGVGRALYDANATFRDALDAVCKTFDPHLSCRLRDVLFAAETSEKAALLHETRLAQPAIFALEVALFRLMESWGVVPEFLLGHSVGELAAAHVAGVLSLPDACTLVAARGRLMQALPRAGAMCAIEASELEVRAALASWTTRVDLAAVNTPTSTVISGDPDAVLAIEAQFKALGRRTTRLRVSHAFHSHHMDAMLSDFAAIARGIAYAPARIRIVSNVTGKLVDPSDLTDPDYWVRHVRSTVRFADGMSTLHAEGVRFFLELGPDAVLSALVGGAFPTDTHAVSLLRAGRSELDTPVAALGFLHVHGRSLDWKAFFTPFAARRVSLPTYAFQRERFWLDDPTSGNRDVASAGLASTKHPLLGAAVRLADGDGFLFTTRLALADQPWLSGHAVFGNVVLPGTAFVELALVAATHVGLNRIDELTIEAPLVVASSAVYLQLFLGDPDETGRRHFTIHAREEHLADDAWTRHATGFLTPDTRKADFELETWPPTGATPVVLDGLYGRLADEGLAYGPEFQGLRALYEHGGELYAEAVLPESIAEQASDYALHPALFDAVLHAIAVTAGRSNGAALPFSWTGISLYARAATTLRVRIVPNSDASIVSLDVADATGRPVARVDALATRLVAKEQLTASASLQALLHLDWTTPLENPSHANADDEPWSFVGDSADGVADALRASRSRLDIFPDVDAWRNALDASASHTVVVSLRRLSAEEDVVTAAHREAERVLTFLQGWLADDRCASSRLVFSTHGAVSTRDDDVIDLVHAPIWGLVRSAQNENPDRLISLVDSDDTEASYRALVSAVTRFSSDNQLAIRQGNVLVPRLVRLASAAHGSATLDPNGTVLITGGTGTLGSILARHLVSKHGVKHLLLTSRRGPRADGAVALKSELEAGGAHVILAACDVADRGQLEAVLAAIPSEHPLVGVIHAAGSLDDGLFTSLTPERLHSVLRTKLDAAFHLHELTEKRPLAAFVLYSSLAGVIGSPGQANYAAANVFLDALAAHRKAQGLPALSLDWGYWQDKSALTQALSEADRKRFERWGVRSIAQSDGLTLFDAALARPESALVAAPLDTSALAKQADALPALFHRLVRAHVARPDAVNTPVASSLRDRLRPLDASARHAELLALVQSQVALALGMKPADVEPRRPLKDLGLDSLMAVEIRNRLAAATGLRLRATLLFDHPTADALAHFVMSELLGNDTATTASPKRVTTNDDPIAIVAMSCRFPGGIETPEQLWNTVSEGRDLISPFPANRGWDTAALFDPDPAAPGKSYTREGGFLHDADLFDPAFFAITPREALAVDPQQRILLETTWESFERAGIDPTSLHGSQTGVFVGVMYNDYASRLRAAPADLEGYVGLGSSPSIASGRIAYTFGLHGPTLTLDTACSSSLVAVHLACQALQKGECSLALAGGVAVMATPAAFVTLSRQRALAADGRSRAFAAEASGAGWSEGAGMLVLERLSDAKRHGHPILAVLRASAVNQDGKSQGLTAPNGPAQERLIRQALATAGLAPNDVDVVEAHGTGTALGDPIEAHALLATYGQGRADDRPLWLGSLKSNLGHTQAAAGVGSIIKMVLAMEHGILPKTLHADRPSPHIDWSAGNVRLLNQPVPWTPNGSPRRAAVSSFGISGTNAHVILEEPPKTAVRPASGHAVSSQPLPIVLSAKSEAALRAQAVRLRRYLDDRPELSLGELASSLATTRTHFEHRAAIVVRELSELRTALDALITSGDAPNLVTGTSTDTKAKLVFVFPGQGSQWAGMARPLLATSAVFRAEIERCERALAPYVDWSLLAVLEEREGAPSLERVDVAQPTLFATMVALAAVWRSIGVQPEAVVGHSQGEIAAAYVAGALSLDDAARIVARRSQELVPFVGRGSMAAVQLSLAELEPFLASFEDRISVAAINSPSAVSVAGEPDAVDALLARLEDQQVFALKLRSPLASHSRLIDPIREPLFAALDGIAPHEARIPFYSTVTGDLLDGKDLVPSYWFDNLRRPVRFAEATQRLADAGARFFIEVSPHPLLLLPLQEILDEVDTSSAVGSLWQDEGDLDRLLLSLGELHTRGYPVDWNAFFEPLGARHVPLPTYAFQRERFWLDDPISRKADVASAGLVSAEHPLLGAAVPLADSDGFLFTGGISLADHPWLAAHAVFDNVILPGTAFVELAFAAAAHVGLDRIDELTLEAPLVLAADVRIQLAVSPRDDDGRRAFSIHGCERVDSGTWTRFATGFLAPDTTRRKANFDLETWPPEGATPVVLDGLYGHLAEAGLFYGPEFQGLRALYERAGELFAEVVLPESIASQAADYALHPALFDAALHALAAEAVRKKGAALPFSWSGVSLYATAATTLRVRIAPTADAGAFSLDLADATGRPVARVDALAARPIAKEQLTPSAPQQPLLHLDWVAPLENASPAKATDEHWSVLGDRADRIADALRSSVGAVDIHRDFDSWTAALDANAAQTVVVPLPRSSEGDLVAAAHRATEGVLTILQAWLADDRCASSRLVFLTHGAVSTRDSDVIDLVHAPIWGLVRSAQSENPDRLVSLVDSDDTEASCRALASAVDQGPSENQLALRQGNVLVPRLVRLSPTESKPARLDPDGTVLITGGTGTLGGVLARHLASKHGVKHLLLTSRQGPRAEGAADLEADLEACGAHVTVAACDVADRDQLEALLATISSKHPLTGVVHAAGSLDDGLFTSLTPERLHSVLRTKLDAAFHLHELTKKRPLAAFVLYSSVAGVLGNAGQANYAAANTFLDALAAHRKASGLPALSLDWGYWQDKSALTDALSDADRKRIERSGLRPISRSDGLAFFDAAFARPESALIVAPFDTSILAKQAHALPAVFQGLVRARITRPNAVNTPAASSLQHRLLSLDGSERQAEILALVQAQVALVFGMKPGAVDPLRPLKDLGLDSLMAVEIRNRLAATTGLRLRATLLFDQPTPDALARFLTAELVGIAPADSPQRPKRIAASDDPIAIVAMSCRLPGGIETPEQLWTALTEERDLISPFPANRGWDTAAIFDPDPDVAGKSYAREGGFLHDADLFDPAFFAITPREALAVDPQQRILLETCWESFERAGIDPASLQGSQTGVFVGVMYNDYATRLRMTPADLEGYVGIGSSASIASGRIAYTFGLHGPTLTLDTACSSSLVAVHLACQALQKGECSLALAGGVTVMATPGAFIAMSRQRAMSPDGRCRAFSAEANGAGWSEGAGILVLERLSDAKRHGHPILAVLRGSAVNQDGKSQGLTAPNGPAQERLIHQALATAGLAPQDIDVVDAHGTGTALGDPIEAHALLATYGQGRAEDQPLFIGSLKSNLGHTQAAAGVAGVIKMVLAMQHGILPKTLHADRPSPHIDWSTGNVRLLNQSVPWAPNGHVRRAGVSSFGVSGTNAHVIIEEPPTAIVRPAREPASSPLPILLSAKSDRALRAQAAKLRRHLEAQPELALRDVASSLAMTRSHFDHRAAIVARDTSDLRATLEALESNDDVPNLLTGTSIGAKAKLVFVFPGQGSQWSGMARPLLATSSVFRDEIERCERALAPYVDWSLLAVLEERDGAPSLERVDVAQPTLFAVMVALAATWRSLGIHPDAVIGHSQGEIAAAYVAGALSLDDAARIVARRSQELVPFVGRGSMAAIQLSLAELEPFLAPFEDRISIAAVNSPNTVSVAGEPDAVDALLAQLEQHDVFALKLGSLLASHSRLVDPVREPLMDALSGIQPRSTRIPFYSTVTGEELDGKELGPGYWFDNLRRPVRFAEATQRLASAGARFFVEVSPHPLLLLPLQETLDETDASCAVGSLWQDEGQLDRLLLSLGELHTRGCPIDWNAFFEPLGARRVPLPTYAFQRERFWLDDPSSRKADVASAGLASAEHPLLGAAVPLAEIDGFLFTGHLSLADHPWLAGHAVFDNVVLPGTAFVELAFAAASHVGLDRVDELTLEAPLVLSADLRIQVTVSAPDDDGRRPFSIHGRERLDDGAWTRFATGFLASDTTKLAPELDLDTWPPAGATPIVLDGLYRRLADAGLFYGPEFQGLRTLYERNGELFAEVVLPESIATRATDYALHPALFDAALHALARGSTSGDLRLPFSWSGISLYATGASSLRVRIAPNHDAGSISLDLADPAGRPVAHIDALVARPIAKEQLTPSLSQQPLLRLEWTALPAPTSTEPRLVDEHWTIVGTHDEALASALRARLRRLDVVASFDACTLVPNTFVVPLRSVSDATDLVTASHRATEHVLTLLQTWLQDDRYASARLIFLTHRAVSTRDGDLTDLAHSPVWGLVRSAQAENPERRLSLVDSDGSDESNQALVSAVTQALTDKQLALRAGRAVVPRLAKVVASAGGDAPRLHPNGTVLITGGTGTLGSFLARHLASTYGVKHLVLTSRQGPRAEGADVLAADLEALGAHVTLAACDVAHRDQLEALLAAIPNEHPLTAVVHVAGSLDDGLVTSLTPERLHSVLRTKLDAAFHLHELTAERGLAAFVLYSSIAGVLGNPGQANYAAANAFLDALAAHRKARGLSALALDWGYWQDRSALTRALSDADRSRFERAGLRPLSRADGLALFDAAFARPESSLVAAPFDVSVLAKQAHALPAIFHGLVRARVVRPSAAASPEASSLRERLHSLGEVERKTELLELVRKHVGLVLGMNPADLEAQRPLKDIGLDSLMAVEIRNRLAATTGLRLRASLVFDHPTPDALARFLTTALLGTEASPARARLRSKTQSDADDPIAIVSMSCRLPGGVQTPEDLWTVLSEGRDVIGPFPSSREWNTESIFDPNPEASGKTYTREGGFLYDAEFFEPAFWGIGSREALALDPQQRLLLETTWESFERAGIAPASLQGSQTGVFVGVMYGDYFSRLRSVPADLEVHIGTGAAASVASGRLAYTFGLHGPTVTVDTACSSSLVAIHLACQALRQGECSLAVAGGVTVMATPAAFVFGSRTGALATDGRCRAFAANANGSAWAEGAGMLVLERLSDARRNGHPVVGILRGSAVNQDGKSQGLTAPNGPAQERVIEQALLAARLRPENIDAVEGHGTGTALGDPIEAHALLATYGAAHSVSRPLWLGSLKSNLGHTQSAAGVAGIIKMVLAMQHGVLPKTLHAAEPSPHIDWSSGTMRLLDEAVSWPESGEPRRAAVSSFGISGTNAHVIVEQAPPQNARVAADRSAAFATLPLCLSAKTPAALRAYAQRIAEHLASPLAPSTTWRDVAFTANALRTHFEHRLVVSGATPAEWSEQLLAFATGRRRRGIVTGEARDSQSNLVFVFSGHGSQWVGMGRELMATSAVFREHIERCDAAFRAHVPWSLTEELRATEAQSRLAEGDDVVQPTLFAIQTGIAAVWASFGVTPSVVIGHSLGEVAAAFTAGALSLEDAARVVCIRGKLVHRLRGRGGLAIIEMPLSDVERELVHHDGRLSIAATNGLRSTVVAGDTDAITTLIDDLTRREVFARRVNIQYASHSHHVDELRSDLVTALADLKPRQPSIRFASTCDLGDAGSRRPLDAEYWWSNLREPVRLVERLGELIANGHDLFVEVSPHPVLAMPIEESLREAGKKTALIPSLRRGEPDSAVMLEALATLHCAGYPVSWETFLGGRGTLASLPTYPWQRERYWLPLGSQREGQLVVVADEAATKTERPELLYEVAWRDVTPSHSASRSTASERWLILTDQEVGPALARALESEGNQCTLVAGEDRAHATSLLEAEAWDGVVHLWGSNGASSSTSLDSSRAEAACASVLATLASMASAGSKARLWVITRNAEPVGGIDVRPEQATLWGLGRVIALEHPGLWGGLIDLDDGGPLHAGTMARLLTAPDSDEDQIALRGQRVCVARLVRREEKPADRHLTVRSDGAYLVTGGLGGLGLAFARWLSERGAKHLVLIARSALPATTSSHLTAAERSRLDVVSELRARGVEVEVVAADTADRTAMHRILSGRRWRGVIHAAGTAARVPLVAPSSLDELQAAFRAKVAGTTVLYELTEGQPLDFFVMLSSAAAIWGGHGQGHYAAANHFMDGLAQHGRSRGRPMLSVNLGGVRGGLMTAEAEAFFERMGLRAMSHETVLEATAATVALDVSQRTIAHVDWAKYKPLFEVQKRRRFFDEIDISADRGAKGADAGSRWLRTLRQAPSSEQPKLLGQFLREQMSEVLGMATSELGDDTRLVNYGMDSLRIVALRRQLETHLELNLPVSDLWAQGTLAKTQAYLLGKLAISAQPEPTTYEAPESAADTSATSKWVIVPRPRANAAVRLFCFPYAGGGPSVFIEWAERLPPEIELCIVALPGRHERIHEPVPSSIEEIVADLVTAIEPLLDRPFAFFAHCLGAILMFETTRALRARGKSPVRLFPSGAGAPSRYFVPGFASAERSRIVSALRAIGFASEAALGDERALQELLPPVLADFVVGASYRYEAAAPLEIPFTTFAGTHDEFSPNALVREWPAETLADCSHVILDGGHYFLRDKQSDIIRVVVEDLNAHLAPRQPQTRAALARVRKAAEPRRSLVCIPGAGGSVDDYAGWREGLPDDLDVYVADLPGRKGEGSEIPLASIDDIVEWILPALRERQDHPFMLFGHDLGAVVAFESIRRLRREGARLPDRLFASAAMAPHVYYFPPVHQQPADKIDPIMQPFVDGPTVPVPAKALRADARVMSGYAYRTEAPLDVPITILTGDRDFFIPAEAVLLWRHQTATSFEHRVVTGTHDFIRGPRPPAVEVVRAVIEASDSKKTT